MRSERRAKFKMASGRKRAQPETDSIEDVTIHEVSGFKFTRQSRYRKAKDGATKRAKNDRRSSFVPARKERKSAVSVKSELYKNIPTDLKPEERLRKLMNACLEGALERLDTEPSKYNVDGIPNFTAEAKEVFSHLQQLVTETDVVHYALKTDNSHGKVTPNPRNEELETKVVALRAATQRLKIESEKWDELLSLHQEEAKRMESRECQKDEIAKDTDQCPDFLSNEQRQLLSEKPSLKSIMDKLEEKKKIAILQVGAVSQAVNTIKHYEEVCRSYINEQTSDFGETTFESLNTDGTPRTNIRQHLKKS